MGSAVGWGGPGTVPSSVVQRMGSVCRPKEREAGRQKKQALWERREDPETQGRDSLIVAEEQSTRVRSVCRDYNTM